MNTNQISYVNRLIFEYLIIQLIDNAHAESSNDEPRHTDDRLPAQGQQTAQLLQEHCIERWRPEERPRLFNRRIGPIGSRPLGTKTKTELKIRID